MTDIQQLHPADLAADQSRTLVMGVINVTPDSFSDGGRWYDPEAAIAHGHHLLAEGADLLDVGGESTRPGAARPSADEELRRVLPVVTALARQAVVSVDTMRADVAAACIEAGAQIINDVSGGLADRDMLSLIAETDVDYVCQHWRGHGDVMQQHANYHDVVQEVREELSQRLDACHAAGIDPARIIADPGLGFAKGGEQDWQILAHLYQFTNLGHRLLIGASRKRFLGSLLDDRPADGRDVATAAVSVICAQAGVWAVRTHEVRGQRDAIAVATKVARSARQRS